MLRCNELLEERTTVKKEKTIALLHYNTMKDRNYTAIKGKAEGTNVWLTAKG